MESRRRGGPVLGDSTGVVTDVGAAVGVVHATPRERVVAEGKIWYT